MNENHRKVYSSGSQTVSGAAASLQGSRELLQFFTILSFFIHIFLQFADVDISQCTLDIWFHMLICIVIRPMCCVYDSFGTKLHATKLIDMPLKFLETAHPSAVSKSRNYMYFSRKLKEFYQQNCYFYKQASIPSNALPQGSTYNVHCTSKIAKCKEPHTIGEELILPAAVDDPYDR